MVNMSGLNQVIKSILRFRCCEEHRLVVLYRLDARTFKESVCEIFQIQATYLFHYIMLSGQNAKTFIYVIVDIREIMRGL